MKLKVIKPINNLSVGDLLKYDSKSKYYTLDKVEIVGNIKRTHRYKVYKYFATEYPEYFVFVDGSTEIVVTELEDNDVDPEICKSKKPWWIEELNNKQNRIAELEAQIKELTTKIEPVNIKKK